jgi:hypothetical protein
MALVTFVLGQLGRKMNDIVQAVFGWSVTALFGKLQRRAQVLVTAALVLSLLWPLFVIGVVAPSVSGWALALVPFRHWFSDGALRIVWSVLAVIAPLGVGLLIHIAVGRKPALVSMVHGYQLALGFFAAFVVVVITLPIVKIASLIRRWSDEHVYMQAHEHAYDDVLQCLVEACEDAGLHPKVSDAPRSMVLATTIMRTLARGAVAPFVTEKLRRVTADGIELYLYPGDLLLRGKPFIVGRARATLTRTRIDAYAYLVDSDKAKPIQDVLARLSRDVEDAIERGAAGPPLAARLATAHRTMKGAEVSFLEWSVLDGLARKLERRMLVAGLVDARALPLDDDAEHAPQHPGLAAPGHAHRDGAEGLEARQWRDLGGGAPGALIPSRR